MQNVWREMVEYQQAKRATFANFQLLAPNIKQYTIRYDTKRHTHTQHMKNLMAKPYAFMAHGLFSFSSVFHFTVCYWQIRKLLQIYICVLVCIWVLFMTSKLSFSQFDASFTRIFVCVQRVSVSFCVCLLLFIQIYLCL